MPQSLRFPNGSSDSHSGSPSRLDFDPDWSTSPSRLLARLERAKPATSRQALLLIEQGESGLLAAVARSLLNLLDSSDQEAASRLARVLGSSYGRLAVVCAAVASAACSPSAAGLPLQVVAASWLMRNAPFLPPPGEPGRTGH